MVGFPVWNCVIRGPIIIFLKHGLQVMKVRNQFGKPTLILVLLDSSRTLHNRPNGNELVLGLLDAGVVLIDDVSVIEDPSGSPRELIQNGGFEGDALGGGADKWRLIGTHGSHGNSVIVTDPDNGANKALRVVATGRTEHMHNHLETTLKSGASFVTIQNGTEYSISFRAKWISGSNQLNSRLYFNRVAKTNLLATPALGGTPGAENSAFVANGGPTYSSLSHSPVLPVAGEDVKVSVSLDDPDGIASAVLRYSVNEGAFQSTSMNLLSGTTYEGTIPSVAAGSTIQFYVDAMDTGGATSFCPATGPESRALVRVDAQIAGASSPNTLQIIMNSSDRSFLHSLTNVMSNDYIGCTVVYNNGTVFYDSGVRLRSSERGRSVDARVGFTLRFNDNNNLFRGVHQRIKIDRSGWGRG